MTDGGTTPPAQMASANSELTRILPKGTVFSEYQPVSPLISTQPFA